MNSPIHINKCPNADAAVTKASQDLAAALQQALAENTDILLLLSGGGNLVVAQNTQGLINQSRITTYVLDERFSRDPAQNNSLQLQAAGIEVELTVPAATESVEEFAARFNGEITTWLLEHPQGKIICTWGMGPDGHVAGISPMPDEADRYQETFYQTTQLVVGYEGNLQPPTRVTVTPTFICQKIDILLGVPSKMLGRNF